MVGTSESQLSPIYQLPNRRALDKHFISELVSEPVSEFCISPGSKHGDNIQGTLIAVDVKTASKKIIHLVIKSVLPMTGVIDMDTLVGAKFISVLRTYPREIVYYNRVRPIFQQALSSSSSQAFSKPVFYSGFLDKKERGLYDYIALEDLRPTGYKMEDKFKALNFDQVSAVLKNLALHHAVSYSLLKTNQDLRKIYEDPEVVLNSHEWDLSWHENVELTSHFNVLISKMLQIAKENGQESEALRLEKYTQIGYDILMGLWKRTGTEEKYFPVLIHGDLWTNNILFKYLPNGTVEDVKFIDFQLSRFGNIYEDLEYFLFTSTTASFRKDHLNTCLHIYFQEFVKVIEKEMDSDLPQGFTEEAVISTFLENMDYGLCYGMVAIPFQLGIQPPPQTPSTPLNIGDSHFSDLGSRVICPNEVKPDFQKFLRNAEDDLEKATRCSLVAKKRIKEMIDEMVERGLLK